MNAVAIAFTVPRPHGDLPLRIAHHLFDATETIGVGAAAAATLGALIALAPLPRWVVLILYAAAATWIQSQSLGFDLWRQALGPMGGRIHVPLYALFLTLTGVGIPALHLIGTGLSRFPRLRLIPVAIAVAAMVVNHLLLPDDYFGLHCSISWGAATLAGASIAPWVESLARGPRARSAFAALASAAVFGIAVPPPNSVRIQLFRQPCALAPWVLATTLWRAPELHAPVSPRTSAWLADRSKLPDVAPTTPPLLPSPPVVVLLTIDAVRADVLEDPANDALFPSLTGLKRRGVRFTRVVAPGAQTATTLTAMFSGRYYSEMRWTEHGVGATRFLYPADDPSPRFPKLLSDHGVQTAIFCSTNFQAGEFGIAPGFREEVMVAEGRQHASAADVVGRMLDRLGRGGNGPLFAYAHLTEPHAPYDRGRKDGTERERYLSEIAVADEQVGRVERLLERKFPNRWLLIVASDHGEAFGEHGGYQHTKTLYDEILRVPLIVRGAGISQRRVDQLVGLMDLGPTLLDLFGVATPATFGGQSLVPLLRGQPAELSRPLFAEARLARALYVPDGLKVIEDQRRKFVEVYDLVRDPGESRNLFDAEPGRSDEALATLRAFFDARTYRANGYSPPFRR
ncbi:MAG: sulfatase [Deltaproteobacteria bacterium]|nr:sulfatase [Deltaproteobacteria bacterium]